MSDPDALIADEPEETGPLRRCLVTRARLPKEKMLRFAVSLDRVIVPDLTEKLPGRGMWLSARADVIETAQKRGAFARGARGAVTVPADLVMMIDRGLSRRIAELLGVARRAGQVVAGFEKAREWLASGRAGLIVQASDGSVDERARFVGGRDIPVASPLPGAELGAVFGRDRAVHVAVAKGRLAEAIAVEADRLAGLRQAEGHGVRTKA